MKQKLESAIVREICDWLQTKGLFFWRQNTQPVFSEGRFRAMGKFAPRGLPDIMVLHKGRFITLEVKKPDFWKYTDDQQEMKEKIISNGGAYHLVTSIEMAQEVFNFYL